MEIVFELESPEEAMALFGMEDRNLRRIRERYEVGLVARQDVLKVTGPEFAVTEAKQIIDELLQLYRAGDLSSESAEIILGKTRALKGPSEYGPQTLPGYGPRNLGQEAYLKAVRDNDIVLSIGPAGTGKTFLAVLMAVDYLKQGLVEKIVLVRPAVEAGEHLGFLPGTFEDKINPYLRPLYDALNEILDFELVKKYTERDQIEVIPLAYMRGRTLNNAFIILDEAQNSTRSQMRMFLTRMGMGSKIIATGDVTQVDIPSGHDSGLMHAVELLRGIPGVAVQQMSEADIVRHPLVGKIVRAYEKWDSGTDRKKSKRNKRRS